jgi:hypothetical protein
MEAERVSEPNGYVETNKSVARSVVNPSFASDFICFELDSCSPESALDPRQPS